MDRLSALDASFLRVESPTAHMHVGWLSTLRLDPGGQRLDSDALAQRVAARLHLAPRFRQRVLPAPVGEPAWADDRGFRLDRHLVVHEGKVAGSAALSRLAGRFLSQPLDRSRPLWSILVVPQAGAGRAAVLGKVHHAMVDGIAAVELGMLLFDLAPDAEVPEPGDWMPEPADSSLRLAMDSIADGALEQFRTARRIAAMGLSPERGLRLGETMRRAAFSLAEDVIRPAPASFLNPPIGPRRSLVIRRLPLARLERLKRARGVKLNDVVLAVVAGALRRFAAVLEEEARPLRTMIPVNVRGAAESGPEGNRITFAFVDLPIDEPSAAVRMDRIHSATSELKRSGRIAGSDALLRSVGQLPGFLKERAAHLAASPRMYNLTVSNVPGPRMPLFAAGAEVEAIYPVIPVSDGHAMSIGALTYRDSIHFAAYVDPRALPEAGELGTQLSAAVTELEHSVGVRTGRRPSAAHKTHSSPRVHDREQPSRLAGGGRPASAQSSQRGCSNPAYS
jgi:WS/DGAT/MGAT family acyltransferase